MIGPCTVAPGEFEAVARPRSFDASEVTLQALAVFWERGYEATSIEHLVCATGLSRSSIYQAFGSKQGLYDSVLSRYVESVESVVDSLIIDGGGLDAIVAWFRNLSCALPGVEADGSGCLVVNAVAELGATDPEIRALGDRYQQTFQRAFLQALAVAADRGEIDVSTIERRATMLTYSTMGLLLAARGRANPDPNDEVEAIVAEVESWRA